MKRRTFVKVGLLTPAPLIKAQPSQQEQDARLVPAGTDIFGDTHTLGFSKIMFKVSSVRTAGGMFVMEHDNLGKGGPYRHIHPAQDEWLYAMKGEFRVEIGDQKFTLKPGDSILMPRKAPHVWAQVSELPGKLLIAFTPAGRMEEFFGSSVKPASCHRIPTSSELMVSNESGHRSASNLSKHEPGTVAYRLRLRLA